jgi:hypothetical protein
MVCTGAFTGADKYQAKRARLSPYPFHVVGENVTMIETKSIP